MHIIGKKADAFHRKAAMFLGVITTIATFGAIAAVAPPARAATGDTSTASASSLSGGVNALDITGLDLSTLLPAVQSAYPSAPGDVTGGLNIPATVPDLAPNLPLIGGTGDNAFLQVGAVTNDANTAVDSASASSDVAGITLNLTQFLNDPALVNALASSVVDQLSLSTGEVSATADAAPGATPTGSYNVADADVTIHSPLVAGLGTSIDNLLPTSSDLTNGLTGSVSGLLSNVLGGLGNSTLTGVLGTLLGSGLDVNIPALSVDLQSALAPVLTEDFGTDGVTLNIANGTVTIDLNKLLTVATGNALNAQPVNTKVLSSEVLTALTTALTSAVNDLTTEVNTVLTTALDNVTISAGSITASVLGTVSLDVELPTGTVQDYIDGNVNATIALSVLGVPITVDAGTLVSGLIQPLGAAVQGVLTSALDTVQTTVLDPLLAPTALGGIGDLLSGLLDITVNNEPTAPAANASYSRAALNVKVLTSLVDLTVADAQAMSTAAVPPAAPTIDTIASGASPTTITGTGVTGDTVVVTVDGTAFAPVTVANGTWSVDVSGTTFANGSHTVSAVQYLTADDATSDTNGSDPATATFTVSTTSPVRTAVPTVTSPAAGSTVTTTPTTITGTGVDGDTITVTFSDNKTATTTVANGKWSVTVPSGSVVEGANDISVVQSAPGQTASDPVAVSFTVDTSGSTTGTTTPTVTDPTNGGTATYGDITISGTGKAGDTIVVTLPDGSTITTTVGSDGKWSVTVPSGELGSGLNTIKVVEYPSAADAKAGTNGSTATTVKFTVKVASRVMYRLYNPNSGEHFYTHNLNEKNVLVGVGWNYEGIGWYAPVTSSVPVYRLYNPNAGDHFYTKNLNEKNSLVKVGWNYEGIGWYSNTDTATEVPLYRAYNPNATVGTHNYTTNIKEQKHIVSVGWRDEGIGWYGVKQ